MMRAGVPFVAFSLDGTTLKITSLASGRRGVRDGVQEGPCLELADLNSRGLGTGASDIGNYVLGFLTIEYPEIMNQFHNLAVVPERGPSLAELDQRDKSEHR
jgi:hypothetical protein